MPTPHFNARPGDFAPTVLMPGDPLRAKHIADAYLTGAQQVNAVRGMLGFTGTYQGMPISVMGSGMGIPSISIYATELYTVFGVQQIIRVGSCGAVRADLQLQDILIGMGSCTDSQVNRFRLNGHDFAAIADYALLESAVATAKRLRTPVRVGNLFSTDSFYAPDSVVFEHLEKMGILGIEMEAAGLYGCAAEYGKQALAICTVADHLTTKASLTTEQRQTSFDAMISLALETAKVSATTHESDSIVVQGG